MVIRPLLAYGGYPQVGKTEKVRGVYFRDYYSGYREILKSSGLSATSPPAPRLRRAGFKKGGIKTFTLMLKRVLKRIGIVIVGAYVLLVVYRMFVIQGERNTEKEVAKIHATKLSLDDVMGKNLPPDPGALAGKTVQGIDANKNGIRDDVELAIFKEYPNSAKTRAVLLQYALALQMEVSQTVVNKGTVTAVAEDSGRAHLCVGEITSRSDMNRFVETTERFYSFIETKQLNTEARKQAQKDFYNGKLGSYASPDETCDLDLSKLPN